MVLSTSHAANQTIASADMNAIATEVNALATVGVASANGVSIGPTTTSTTLVDMTDMSITIVTAATSDILVWFWALLSCTNTSTLSLSVSFDASDQSAVTPAITSAAGAQIVSYMVRIIGVTAGSHAIKGRWATSAGTATAGGAQRSLMALEVRHFP